MTVGWHVITGEYPPMAGGVGDYSRLVATELAKACDLVDVWTSPQAHPPQADAGVSVHCLPDHFGPRSLLTLRHRLAGVRDPRRVLLQYVPHAFGWKALNVPFCLWLAARRRQPLWVMFHEVAYPIGRRQSLRHNTVGAVTRLMAMLLARAAERVFVSIPAWQAMVRPLVPRGTALEWLPVPSSVAVAADDGKTRDARRRYARCDGKLVGHFGTYGDRICAQLRPVIESLLRRDPTHTVLLIGRGSIEARQEIVAAEPPWESRIHATGPMSHEDISRHVSACDVMVQPYPDGVSTRRTTAMACLAHGMPLVTSSGALTEPVWRESGAVALAPAGDPAAMSAAVEHLLRDGQERRRRGLAAAKLYAERFDIRHTIATLRCASH
jgi:glycosyltransferase involved in cell wall biosynthesis